MERAVLNRWFGKSFIEFSHWCTTVILGTWYHLKASKFDFVSFINFHTNWVTIKFPSSRIFIAQKTSHMWLHNFVVLLAIKLFSITLREAWCFTICEFCWHWFRLDAVKSTTENGVGEKCAMWKLYFVCLINGCCFRSEKKNFTCEWKCGAHKKASDESSISWIDLPSRSLHASVHALAVEVVKIACGSFHVASCLKGCLLASSMVDAMATFRL